MEDLKQWTEKGYDVVEHLKGEMDGMAYKARIHDTFVQRHCHNGKTPKSELMRHEVQAEYYADARDKLMAAIDVLEVVVDE